MTPSELLTAARASSLPEKDLMLALSEYACRRNEEGWKGNPDAGCAWNLLHAHFFRLPFAAKITVFRRMSWENPRQAQDLYIQVMGWIACDTEWQKAHRAQELYSFMRDKREESEREKKGLGFFVNLTIWYAILELARLEVEERNRQSSAA